MQGIVAKIVSLYTVRITAFASKRTALRNVLALENMLVERVRDPSVRTFALAETVP